MIRLLVIGSANVDHVMKVTQLPTQGQTLMSKDYQIEHGGKGANQAVACARLSRQNTRIDFICHVGDDVMGKALTRAWLNDGINADGLNSIADEATGCALIFIADNGENMIGIAPCANASLTPEALKPHHHLIHQSDWLLVQLETPLDTVLSALTLAKQQGVNTILNPAPATTIDKNILRLVDIIIPNETEAEAITGVKVTDDLSAQRAAQVLHSHGLKTVVITLGRQGAFLSCDDFCGSIPCAEVTPIDTVAAGDTFNGALMVALSEGTNIVAAVKFAHQAAAISVTRKGAQRSIPHRQEL